jgi:hypothetical protein
MRHRIRSTPIAGQAARKQSRLCNGFYVEIFESSIKYFAFGIYQAMWKVCKDVDAFVEILWKTKQVFSNLTFVRWLTAYFHGVTLNVSISS